MDTLAASELLVDLASVVSLRFRPFLSEVSQCCENLADDLGEYHMTERSIVLLPSSLILPLLLAWNNPVRLKSVNGLIS